MEFIVRKTSVSNQAADDKNTAGQQVWYTDNNMVIKIQSSTI